jgi:hypothetical protein
VPPVAFSFTFVFSFGCLSEQLSREHVDGLTSIASSPGRTPSAASCSIDSGFCNSWKARPPPVVVG